MTHVRQLPLQGILEAPVHGLVEADLDIGGRPFRRGDVLRDVLLLTVLGVSPLPWHGLRQVLL